MNRSDDLISRQSAIKLILSGKVGYDSLVECPEECNSMLEWAADEVAKMPTIYPVKNRLQRAVDGKTAEEIYDFLDWLMHKYANQYTDSRSAVIMWLEEGEEDG